jgi:uncharacterized membrane protein YcaP (DUF421 family)
MKITGKRQIGELDVSDLVSTLLISELAAIPIDDPDIPLFNAIIPILFIVSLEIIVSSLKTRSNKFKKYVEGKPAFIIFKGRLLQETLRENRISINELLSEMRIQGIGDIRDVDFCTLEANGKISMLKKRNTSGATAHPLIIDGELNESEIRLLNMTKKEVEFFANETKTEDIFLLTIDDNRSANIIIKEEI